MLRSQSKTREDLHPSAPESIPPTSRDPFAGLFADRSSDLCAPGSQGAEQREIYQHIEAPLDEEDSTSALDSEAAILEPASAALSHEVNRSLARLEMNSLQVKLYLDSIEERIKRMEPRLEQRLDEQHLPLSGASSEASEMPAQPASNSLPEDPAIAPPPCPLPAETTTERRRRRLDIPPSASIEHDLPLSTSDHLSREDLWAIKPWLLARRKQLAIAGAVLLAFVTILTFGTGDHRPSPALPANTPAPAPLGSSAIPKTSAGTPVPPTRDLQPPAVADPQLAASSSQVDGSTASSVAPLSSPSVQGTVGQQIVSSNVGKPSTGGNDERTPGAKPSAAVPNSIVPPSGRVRVSSGVMAGNLLSSSTPKYPGGFATLFHMEGKVTMQAVVARNGTVEDLRVLSGHHLLRGAAQDAVRTWRYRPYIVNGVPVEVATIITVEFHR